MYGCESCKFLRRQMTAKNKELAQLLMMKLSLENTKREYADDCQGYNMAACVDTCPAYPACRALEAGKPRPPRKRKRRVDGDSNSQA